MYGLLEVQMQRLAMRSEQTKNEEKRREKYRVVTSDGLVGWFNPN